MESSNKFESGEPTMAKDLPLYIKEVKKEDLHVSCIVMEQD